MIAFCMQKKNRFFKNLCSIQMRQKKRKDKMKWGRTHLWCSGRSAKSDLNVSVTYLWKYVGNGSVVSKSNIRHRVGVGLCIKNT